MQTIFDSLIIGGGPAGLTAAIYLARFRRRVIVVDAQHSRATLIPESHNYPGFDHGINGQDFIARLRKQAEKFGALIVKNEVADLEKEGAYFKAALNDGTFLAANTIVLATGIVDVKPSLPHMGEFIYQGAVRFCPICDAFEASGKRIAIMGPLSNIISKALFIRTYTRNVVLLPLDGTGISREEERLLAEAGINRPREVIADLIETADGLQAISVSGKKLTFDILYPAMGAHVRSDLAIKLGASCNEEKYLHTDSYQQTTVKGLYAIGDITTDLHQISVATGQASIAACAIHNSLPRNYC